MATGSGSYDDVVATYIHVIRRDSPEAAGTVEQILAAYGTRAALRATLVLTLLKMEVQKNHPIDDFDVLTNLIKGFPAALLLMDRAIAHCLLAWGIPLEAPLTQADNVPASTDEDAPLIPPV